MECSPSPEFLAAIKGSKGDRGGLGIRGLKGSRGPYGNFGPSGPQGRKGEKGGMGPSGRNGEIGLAGPKGEPGKEGLNSNEFLEWKRGVDNELKSLRKMVYDFGSCCTRTPYLPPHLSNREPEECLLVYKNRCFNLTGSKDGPNKTWKQYVDDCESMGGAAANIYDPVHYNLTTNAIRTSRLPHNTRLLLGMRYNVFRRQLLFHNGTAVNFDLPWIPGTPTTHPTHTIIQVLVRSNPYSHDQGLFNRAGHIERPFGLCEFAVKEAEGNTDSGSRTMS